MSNLTVQEIYEKFDKIGSVTFATIDNGYPETRIAHFFAYDDKGLYFRTMTTKPFFHQLVTNKKVSVCGMSSATEVTHDGEGMPVFEPGYSIRITGDCERVDREYIKEKAENSNDFLMGYKDILKYPALHAFRINKARGEIFDFDFELHSRDHKLKRTRFTLNEFTYPNRGVVINDDCVNCGKCIKTCSFSAIYKGEDHYMIDPLKCDACGDCTLVCNFDAIDINIK